MLTRTAKRGTQASCPAAEDLRPLPAT